MTYPRTEILKTLLFYIDKSYKARSRFRIWFFSLLFLEQVNLCGRKLDKFYCKKSSQYFEKILLTLLCDNIEEEHVKILIGSDKSFKNSVARKIREIWKF